MNKNTKKILALSVMCMFVFMFAINIIPMASAAEGDGLFVTLWKAFFGGLGGDGTGSFGETLQNKFGLTGAASAGVPSLISFFLLMFIVGLLIYDIVDLLPFISKPWMKGAFSIAFTVLAFLFFDMNQINILTANYQGVAVALIAILPFIVISAFVWKLDKKAKEEIKPSYSMFGSAIWIGFGIFMIFRLTEISNIPRDKVSSPIWMAYTVLTLAALLMVFMHSKLVRYFNRRAGATEREIAEAASINDMIDELLVRIKTAESLITTRSTDATRKRHEADIARWRKQINDLQGKL